MPAVYLVANLTAATVLARKFGWSLFPAIALAYGAMHFGYGAGFLVGLVRFWNRWGPAGKTGDRHVAAVGD